MDHPTLLFPVGHLLGSIYYGPTEDSVRFIVRIGLADVDLTAEEYVVWTYAHGVPGEVDDTAWTRRATEDAARTATLADPATACEQLLSKGLLQEVRTGTGDVARFAGAHQLHPLLPGLGNSLTEPAAYGIGTPDDPAVLVTLSTYQLWSHAHLEPSLWQACARSAEDDPGEIADGFLRVLHGLLAVNAAYLDVVTS